MFFFSFGLAFLLTITSSWFAFEQRGASQLLLLPKKKKVTYIRTYIHQDPFFFFFFLSFLSEGPSFFFFLRVFCFGFKLLCSVMEAALNVRHNVFFLSPTVFCACSEHASQVLPASQKVLFKSSLFFFFLYSARDLRVARKSRVVCCSSISPSRSRHLAPSLLSCFSFSFSPFFAQRRFVVPGV